ncbi:MAG: hypothetical protein RIC51_01575 [Erythrobacter sp.]|uniref:hypothetical protein n=1 Tax=Erythrobacter sp. TaxID=1042 RepID=UPI0032EAA32D
MKRIIATTFAATAALGLAACDVEQTEEGEMPELEGGNMPEYDVDTPEVDVETEERTVEVPELEVDPADDGDAE